MRYRFDSVIGLECAFAAVAVIMFCTLGVTIHNESSSVNRAVKAGYTQCVQAAYRDNDPYKEMQCTRMYNKYKKEQNEVHN